jgi:hypothetical protein
MFAYLGVLVGGLLLAPFLPVIVLAALGQYGASAVVRGKAIPKQYRQHPDLVRLYTPEAWGGIDKMPENYRTVAVSQRRARILIGVLSPIGFVLGAAAGYYFFLLMPCFNSGFCS